MFVKLTMIFKSIILKVIASGSSLKTQKPVLRRKITDRNEGLTRQKKERG